MQLVETIDPFGQRCARGKVEQQRTDARADEVVGAGSAEWDQPGRGFACHEIEHDFGVVEDSDDRVVMPGDRPDCRCELGRGTAARLYRQRLEPGHDGTERLGSPLLRDVGLGAGDDLERRPFALVGRAGPRREAVPAEHDAAELGMLCVQRLDLQRELEARAGATAPTRSLLRSTP